MSNDALISIPDDPFVAYWGKGFADVFTIFILIGDIRAKLKFQAHKGGSMLRITS
jgi:hypothetical protein